LIENILKKEPDSGFFFVSDELSVGERLLYLIQNRKSLSKRYLYKKNKMCYSVKVKNRDRFLTANKTRRNTMKKVISVVLVLALVAMLAAGCSGSPEQSTASPETTGSSAQTTEAETTKAQSEEASTAEAVGEDLECDIVIVGAGGAGMVAALQAVDAGAQNVIIVEKLALLGGNSVRSTGGMNAAKTADQDSNEFTENAGVEKTLESAKTTYADNADVMALVEAVEKQYEEYKANPEGYFDSVELFELDTMVGGKAVNNLELVKTLAENSADSITWLRENQGIDLLSVGSFGGASVKRIHRPLNAEGKTTAVGGYMVPILQANCEASPNIQILTETTATEIIMEGGAAAGIVVTGADGSYSIHAKAVVLASGGFGANNDMVKKYQPTFDGYITTNAPGITGDGIAMAEAVGAATVDMEQIQLHPTVYQATGALITEGLRGDGAILVNANGERFVDEVGTRDVVSAAEFAQPGNCAYLIVDQAMVDASSVIAGYINKEMTVKGETYEELAEAAGIDPAAFAATMEKWNACVADGVDEEFGRTSFANPLNTAPYYSIQVAPGVHHTMGGLQINTSAEVLDTDGNAIPGLYAAGEVTGGVHGANRLGGNAVADIVVFGRIAGSSAQAYAAK
jgi:fumarate reductase flavoprotein subunit